MSATMLVALAIVVPLSALGALCVGLAAEFTNDTHATDARRVAGVAASCWFVVGALLAALVAGS